MIVFSLRRDDLDGGWVADCPYFPGCFGQGESRAEALRSVADAVAAVMEREDEQAERTRQTDLFKLNLLAATDGRIDLPLSSDRRDGV
jgi:predicted RNase H-like HicB family nuclease